MVARLALSTAGQNGQYIGTARVPTPAAAPGSTTCRSFNGKTDRLVLGRSDDLGLNYLVVMTFWRGEASLLADNKTAARLFTQYCVGGTRVAVGINRNTLTLTYTNPQGITATLDSKVVVMDLARRFLGLHVQPGKVTVYLDGRKALEADISLAAPDLARACVGADTLVRGFNGQIDDLAIYQTAPAKTDNWLRYYRSLVRGEYVRDYVATGFAAGHNSVSLSLDGFGASGTSNIPPSRVPVSTPFRTEVELTDQYLEFKLTPGGSGAVRIGVFDTSHDLSVFDLGETGGSYAYDQTGALWHADAVAASGLGTWNADNTIALGFNRSTRALSLWVDGTHKHQLTLPAGTWTAGVNLGGNDIRLNAGQAVPMSLPKDTPGLPTKVWSKLTSEFREMRLAEVCAPLDDPSTELLDAFSGTAAGIYTVPLTPAAGFTPDSFDVSKRVGGGIKAFAGLHTAADDDFFFAIAFSPETSDLTGEKTLLDSPTKWGIKLLEGRLYAYVGDVQISSVNVAFTAGEKYLVGITRSKAGKLMVWCHIGYVLQSSDLLVSQTSSDVWVGSKSDGSAAFAGRLSHLILSSTLPTAWKMTRLKGVYSWDIPSIDGMIPNAADTRTVFEISYRDLVASGIKPVPLTTDCYVGALAKAPDEIAVEFRLVDRKGANPFIGEFIGEWTPHATLLQQVARGETQFLLNPGSSLTGVIPGSPCLVNGEICRVESINLTPLIVVVARGCVDTVPAIHGAGSHVWFYGSTLTSTQIDYVVNDSVETKLLSRSELAEMGEEFAPVNTVTLQGRAGRPYPPGAVTINDQASPVELAGTVQIKWKHRNRVTQGGVLSAWGEGAFTAPVGVTYIVRAYDADSGLLHESSPVLSTVSDYNLLVDYTGDMTVTVTSYESGLACWQTPTLTFAYTDEVVVLMATEDYEAIDSEDAKHLKVEAISAVRAASYSGELPDDWGGIPVAAEGELIGPEIIGVKISEFPELPVLVTGVEKVPLVKDGVNYWADMQTFLDFIVASIPPAIDGKNAYQVWLDAGHVGSTEDFLTSLVGPRGLNSNSARRIQTITAGTGAIICNWGLYDEIRIRMVGPVVLTFQNAVDGQGCMLKLQQDGVGGRTVTIGAAVRFNALVQSYTPTPTAGLVDKIAFIYDSSDNAYDFATFIPGISI